MSNLLALIRGKRKEMAEKRASRGVDIAKMQNGVQYLRIFPDFDDAEGVFFHPFGMHYAKTKEDGKEKVVASICRSVAFGEPCELCNTLMEAKAVHKGNKVMEEVIQDSRSSFRYLVNGALTATPDIKTADKGQLIELPQTVFEDILKLIDEDMTDVIGNPLSATDGYCYMINRTGAGRETRYSVSPSRREGKAAIPEELKTGVLNLESFVKSQDDVNKYALTGKIIAATTGIAFSASSTLSLPATGTTGVGELPGFSSSKPADDVPFDTGAADAAKSAAAQASAVEFTGAADATASATAVTPAAPVAAPSNDSLAEQDLADMMKALEGV